MQECKAREQRDVDRAQGGSEGDRERVGGGGGCQSDVKKSAS